MTFETKTTFRHALAVVALAALSACGGGGGGGSTTPPVTVAPTVDISQTNMDRVAVESLDAGGAGIASALPTVTGVQLQAPAVAAPSPMAAIGQLVGAAARVRPAQLVSGATFNQTINCTGGGTVALTLNYQSQQGLTPGDTLRLVASNCVESSGTTNGTLVLVIVDGTSDGLYVVGDATATALSVTSGGLREQLDGTMRLSFDDRDPTRELVDITSARLDARQFRNGTPVATRTLLDYTYALSIDTASTDSRENFSYRVTGSFPVLGNVSWSARTTTTVYTPGGATNPTAGVGVVTGANGTTLKITVISSNGGGVRLELDRGGDGVVDTTRELTWAELDALRG